MTLWETPSERLKLLRPVEYNAPNGHFDDTAEGIPGPMPLIEEESGVLRMRECRPPAVNLPATDRLTMVTCGRGAAEGSCHTSAAARIFVLLRHRGDRNAQDEPRADGDPW